MLTRLLHKLAAHPWVYDRIQVLAGLDHILERLSPKIDALSPRVVVDVGGGTGNVRNLLDLDCRYVCLDLEMPKLRGFRSEIPEGLAVQGNATAMPFIDGGADLVICKSLSHHLSDSMLELALNESHRILNARGHVILLDAVLNRKRVAGRILWNLDRGSYPRTEVGLHHKFETRFKVIHWETFAVYHEYVFGIGMRR